MNLSSSIPIYRQCELISLNRSTLYYSPLPLSPYNQLLMNLIDEQYTKTPFVPAPQLSVPVLLYESYNNLKEEFN